MSDKIVVRATSDLHGELPEVEKCDLLLVAGDVCPATNHRVDFQRSWIETAFAEWLEDVPAKRVVWVAGNHDFALDSYDGPPEAPYPRGKVRLTHEERDSMLNSLPRYVYYLQDSWIEVLGLKVHGIPWSLGPDTSGWAFEATEPGPANKFGAVQMIKVLEDVPEDVDVLVSHGPPSGFGDLVGGPGSSSGVFLGSGELTAWLRRCEPRLCVYGHNHEGRGRWDFPGKDGRGMTLANVSYLTDMYSPREQATEEFVL